jgi:selenoprotein W-related protein
LAQALVEEFRGTVGGGHPIQAIELVPSGGGIFEVQADGETVFSKKQAGRHCEPAEVVRAIRGLIPA